MGIIIYELYESSSPWNILEQPNARKSQIHKTIITEPFVVTTKTEPMLLDLISKMLLPKTDRIKIEDVKKHIYFKDTDWTNVYNNKMPIEDDVKTIIENNGNSNKYSGITHTDIVLHSRSPLVNNHRKIYWC